MKPTPLFLVLLALGAGCRGDDPARPPLSDTACPDAGATATDADATSDAGLDDRCPRVRRLFPNEEHPGITFERCLYASPLAYEGDAGLEILVAAADRVVALDPQTGAERWRYEVPAPDGEVGTIVATPALIGRLLVLEYHTTPLEDTTREAHYLLALDLETRAMADGFELLTIDGEFAANDGQTVGFRPSNALGRGQIAHGVPPGATLGKVYVTYGNARDIQPWHGFAFEVDLDVWGAPGEADAITGQLITTPEADCGPAGRSGSRERICGGGLWSPSGPLVLQRGDAYELILPAGNGQLDLNRDDFANTLMRVGPGLELDPGCDAAACADFDPDAPAADCVASCTNLFIPRDDVGDPFPQPESGVCDGLGMFACWEKLDYIGGSTPAHVELPSGTRVLAYPTKDGSAYLVDADHLGTLHDRAQLVEICGTPTDECRWDWAGMIVTQPAVTEVGGRPVVLVPTFMPDNTHPAGVVALAIDESSGTPKFERLWSAPDFASADAIARFREHPTRISLQRVRDDLEVAWIVETFRREPAHLLAIDVADGTVLLDEQVGGPGMRFTKPLLHDDVIYLNHCDEGGGPLFLEAFAIDYPAP